VEHARATRAAEQSGRRAGRAGGPPGVSAHDVAAEVCFWDHVPGSTEGGNEVDIARAADDLASYQASVARSREAVAGRSLDEASPGEDYTLRWIYLHMIEEYARHNGHADFLRERIDGATGE